MKNLHVLVLIALIATSGFMLPIEKAHAYVVTTECYHNHEGQPLGTPYTVLQGSVSCPLIHHPNADKNYIAEDQSTPEGYCQGVPHVDVYD